MAEDIPVQNTLSDEDAQRETELDEALRRAQEIYDSTPKLQESDMVRLPDDEPEKDPGSMEELLQRVRARRHETRERLKRQFGNSRRVEGTKAFSWLDRNTNSSHVVRGDGYEQEIPVGHYYNFGNRSEPIWKKWLGSATGGWVSATREEGERAFRDRQIGRTIRDTETATETRQAPSPEQVGTGSETDEETARLVRERDELLAQEARLKAGGGSVSETASAAEGDNARTEGITSAELATFNLTHSSGTKYRVADDGSWAQPLYTDGSGVTKIGPRIAASSGPLVDSDKGTWSFERGIRERWTGREWIRANAPQPASVDPRPKIAQEVQEEFNTYNGRFPEDDGSVYRFKKLSNGRTEIVRLIPSTRDGVSPKLKKFSRGDKGYFRIGDKRYQWNENTGEWSIVTPQQEETTREQPRRAETSTDTLGDDPDQMYGPKAGEDFTFEATRLYVRYGSGIAKDAVLDVLAELGVKKRVAEQVEIAVHFISQGKRPGKDARTLIANLKGHEGAPVDIVSILRILPEKLDEWRHHEDEIFIDELVEEHSQGGILNRLRGRKLKPTVLTHALRSTLSSNMRSPNEITRELRRQLGSYISSVVVQRLSNKVHGYITGTGAGSREFGLRQWIRLTKFSDDEIKRML